MFIAGISTDSQSYEFPNIGLIYQFNSYHASPQIAFLLPQTCWGVIASVDLGLAVLFIYVCMYVYVRMNVSNIN